ncbi:MAG TPA: tryptophan-rich sensory protein [Pyrinomonadaceae bacterium]|nr:tryptophan-rich sensory protein [Pyrinomonadaceae bacterium]
MKANSADRIQPLLVIFATLGTIIFNGLAASGYVNDVSPAEVSARYETIVTPAGYAFSIWSLIYAGLTAFSIYQLFSRSLAPLRAVRSVYILSCVLNCAWIYFWHHDQIAICLVLIVGLLATIGYINAKLPKEGTTAYALLVRAPFGIYLGWLSAASLVNLAILFRHWNIDLDEGETILGVGLILTASALGIFYRVWLANFFAPLAIAWALTAIAVKQSGRTAIVTAAAFGVIACLIAALSFIMNLKGTNDERV